MSRRVMALCVAIAALGSTLLLARAQKGGSSAAPPDKARLKQVLAAWATLDVSRPAVFYPKDPGLVFYSMAPRKYTGWTESEKGAAEGIKTVQSLTIALGDDAAVHHARNVAWTTATIDGELVKKDGSRLKIDARWTSVWEKRGSNWFIVHDHFSMPLPEPSAKAPANNARPGVASRRWCAT